MYTVVARDQELGTWEELTQVDSFVKAVKIADCLKNETIVERAWSGYTFPINRASSAAWADEIYEDIPTSRQVVQRAYVLELCKLGCTLDFNVTPECVVPSVTAAIWRVGNYAYFVLTPGTDHPHAHGPYPYSQAVDIASHLE